MNIIFQAIKLAPLLLWQSLFQPSKAYEFAKENEKHEYIFIMSSFVYGLFLGILIALLHLYLYHDLVQSISFAFMFAFTFAFVGMGTSAIMFICLFMLGLAFIVTSSVLVSLFGVSNAVMNAAIVISVGVGFSVVSFLVVGMREGTFVLIIIGAFIVTIPFMESMRAISSGRIGIGLLYFVLGLLFFWYIRIQWKDYTDLDFDVTTLLLVIVVASVVILVCFATTIEGTILLNMRPYEIIIFHITFCLCYLLISQFNFVSNKLRKQLNKEVITDEDVTNHYFCKAQKASYVWFALFAVFQYAFEYFLQHNTLSYELSIKLKIMFTGFVAMPIFILHIPDSIVCLIIWQFQKRKMMKNYKDTQSLISIYDNSILFKHEMLYIQLPGLCKVMTAFAKNSDIGMKGAIERINYIYWFTFQQEQAKEAIIEFGKDNETAHQYIHYLFIEDNLSFIKILAKANPLAESYMLLVGEKSMQNQTSSKEPSYDILTSKDSVSLLKFRQKGTIKAPDTLGGRLRTASERMGKLEGYRFNQAIAESIKSASQFVAAKTIADFYAAFATFEGITEYPHEIPYMEQLKGVFIEMQEINRLLPKIETITKFETRWSYLDAQKRKFQELAKSVENGFYEPFRGVWSSALNNLAYVTEHEISVMQGSAELSIVLKNAVMQASSEKQSLVFEIKNTGQAAALDVKVTFTGEGAGFEIIGEPLAEIPSMETDAVKTVEIPVRAATPLTASVKGALIYTDTIKANKTKQWSYRVQVSSAAAGFRHIENPYIAGKALAGESSLYYGRDDVYQFINENILAGKEHNTIVCYGLRRSGKSSLLQRIRAVGFQDRQLVPVFLNMQGIADEQHFYREMAKAIEAETKLTQGMKVQGFPEFQDFLDAVRGGLGSRKLVMLVDEFEVFQDLVTQKRMSPIVFNNIRHLMQYEDRLIFLFSGTHKLEEMAADYWSIFFNTAMYCRVSFLDEASTRKLIQEPVAKDLTYDTLAVNQIVSMTSGQPYLTQLICRFIVNRLNNKVKSNFAHVNDVDLVVEEIITDGHDRFSEQLWKDAGELDRLLLSLIADEITGRQSDSVSFKSIFDKTSSITKKYSRQTCLDALSGLTNKEILLEDSGYYCFGVRLFMQWVKMRYPARKMREVVLSGG
jgi:hypothetical protein